MQEKANTSAPAQTAGKKPNFVFILTDNLGYKRSSRIPSYEEMETQ
jgi:hypothetical protein